MIRKLAKGILRVFVAQPWEYAGQGAPAEWEFRVSPDEEHAAVYDPRRGTWMILEARTLRTVAEEERLDRMNRHTDDWSRYVEELDPDDFAGLDAEYRARRG